MKPKYADVAPVSFDEMLAGVGQKTLAVFFRYNQLEAHGLIPRRKSMPTWPFYGAFVGVVKVSIANHSWWPIVMFIIPAGLLQGWWDSREEKKPKAWLQNWRSRTGVGSTGQSR